MSADAESLQGLELVGESLPSKALDLLAAILISASERGDSDEQA